MNKKLIIKLNKIFSKNPNFVFYDYDNESVGDDLLKLISTLLKEQKEKLRDQYAHPTEEGYCCACDYDIAGFEQKLRAERQAIIEMIDNIDIKNITPRELKLKIYKLLK